MISRIKHLQHAKLYPSTRVTNTKSMTPNQLIFRATGFKGFRHIPLEPCSGFKEKRHDFYFFFSSFLFLFLFLFLFGRLHWSSYMGNTNLLWVVNRSKAGSVMSLKVIYFQSIFLIDFYKKKRLIYMQEYGITSPNCCAAGNSKESRNYSKNKQNVAEQY